MNERLQTKTFALLFLKKSLFEIQHKAESIRHMTTAVRPKMTY